MAITRDYDVIIRDSYLELGNIAYQIVSAMDLGNVSTAKLKDLWSRGIKIRLLLKALSYEHALTDERKNKFTTCLIKQAKLRVFGAAPIIHLQNVKRVSVEPGQGIAGKQGIPGNDAFINVEPDVGEVQISVREEIESGVKTFNMSFDEYIEPSIVTIVNVALLSGSQSDKRIREIGESVDTPIKVTLTKGSQDVTASEFLVPSGLDSAYQALLNLTTLNSSGSQIISLADAGITTVQVYTVDIEDGEASPNPQDSDTLSFVYPFFYGATAAFLNQLTLYTQLTKLIEAKATKSVNYDDASKYFYFAYPSSYGALSNIKDGSGFTVFALWDRVDTSGVLSPSAVFNVDSTGLDTDWTHEFIVYRSKLITDIPDQDYQFIF